MKTIFDSVIFMLQKRGGASNYWLEFFDRFVKNNDVQIITSKEDNYLNKDFLTFVKNNTPSVIPEKKHSGSLLRVINPHKLKKVEEPVIFHSTVYRWMKGKNVKNIVTIHDFTHQKYMSGYHKFLNSILKKRSIKHADGIVCISNNTYKDLLEFYPKLKNKKVKIIYNGFNRNIFYHMNKVTLPEKYKCLSEKKFLLYVGQRDGYKNFSFMIDVLSKTDDLYLALVGGNDFEIDNEAISNKIFHFNNVDDSDLNILYNASYCFIYPSLYEGFGIPICEAMNCGCPVIAFNNSSIPEVMNNAGILLNNNDLDGVLEQLKKLEDQKYRDKIIEKQYNACDKFSWDKAYNEMLDFYKEVLEDD